MEDIRIIQLYWDRSAEAIPATDQKYGGYCAAIAQNILGSREDAEECVNDTWLGAWNSMPPQRPSALAAFLGRITRNISFNRYKKSRAEKRGGGQLPAALEELAECVSGSEDIPDTLERQELAAAINDFLGGLSPKKRGIFIRRYWHTEAVSEIAARYGMRENAVSMSLGRTRAELRSFLLERGFSL